MQKGRIEFVEIVSQIGGECRLRNPWPSEEHVQLWSDGKEGETLNGSLLRFETSKGQTLVLLPEGIRPEEVKHRTKS